MAHVRDALATGPHDRDAALSVLTKALGYTRRSPRLTALLTSALKTAQRRGVVEKDEDGAYTLTAAPTHWDRTFLKDQFLASLSQHGRLWTERPTATRQFARWLGYRRTGHVLEALAASLINGLIREGRIESEDGWIRRL